MIFRKALKSFGKLAKEVRNNYGFKSKSSQSSNFESDLLSDLFKGRCYGKKISAENITKIIKNQTETKSTKPTLKQRILT